MSAGHVSVGSSLSSVLTLLVQLVERSDGSVTEYLISLVTLPPLPGSNGYNTVAGKTVIAGCVTPAKVGVAW